ncbi:hypothetical protein AQF98_11240 [Pedobacter sp. Hv1]|nr:hypothetical protein AQF98_11240 [Pedobacter sp. Hv1]
MLLYACKPGIPKEIIQPDQMEKVLFDVHVVDGYVTTIAKKDSATLVASAYYKGIYKKFSIDSALYAKSMNYYYDHPDIMEKIYQQVEKTFAKEKAKNDKMVNAESVKEQERLAAQQNPLLVIKYLDIQNAGAKRTGPAVGSNPFFLVH